MLKQMRRLRQGGRAAKHQHKAAAGGHEAENALFATAKLAGFTAAIFGRSSTASNVTHTGDALPEKKDLEVCANGAGKRVAAQVVERRRRGPASCLIWPTELLSRGSASSLPPMGPASAESQQRTAGAGCRR